MTEDISRLVDGELPDGRSTPYAGGCSGEG
jgi:hypothetical protein